MVNLHIEHALPGSVFGQCAELFLVNRFSVNVPRSRYRSKGFLGQKDYFASDPINQGSLRGLLGIQPALVESKKIVLTIFRHQKNFLKHRVQIFLLRGKMKKKLKAKILARSAAEPNIFQLSSFEPK